MFLNIIELLGYLFFVVGNLCMFAHVLIKIMN
nr:MAG TPA: hypothetical protein [Caudoviricetes sp.]